MRLLTRRLYRAFPELDPYTDEQCRRFMRSARRGRRILFGVVWLVVVVTGLCVAGYIGDYLFELANQYQDDKRQDVPILNALMYLAVCPLIAAPFGTALLIRDWMLRRRVRVILAEDSTCPRCKYRLLGLALNPNSTITCPECGLVSDVDPSLSELTLDEAGRQQMRPVIILPPPPPFWKRRGVRIATRVALVLILIPVLSWVLFFAWLAHQTSLADKALNAGRPALQYYSGSRCAPGMASGDDYREQLMAVLAKAAAVDQLVMANPQLNTAGWWGQTAGIDAVLKDDGSTAQRIAIALAQRYQRDGVLDRLRVLQRAPRATYPRDARGYYGFYAGFIASGPGQSGTPSFLAETNTVWMELSRRAQNRSEFLNALESNLALARLLRDQDYSSDLATACEIEEKSFARVRVALADKPDQAWLDAVQAIIKRQRTELPPGLVFEGDRLAAQIFIAQEYQQILGNDGLGVEAIKNFWECRSAGGRIGSLADNRDRLDLYFKDFEAIVAKPPHARGSVVLQTATDLVIVNACFPDQRYHVIELLDKNMLERHSIDVLLALEQFRVKQGGYPERIEELVPEFLAAMPEDPWSGKPFGYKRTDPATDAHGRAFLLYSVGIDKVDDGGTPLLKGDQESLLKIVPSSAPGCDYIINSDPAPQKPATPPATDGETP